MVQASKKYSNYWIDKIEIIQARATMRQITAIFGWCLHQKNIERQYRLHHAIIAGNEGFA